MDESRFQVNSITSLPEVDVVVPFHLVNQYLLESIKSIKSSKGVSVKVIAVNDTGSKTTLKQIGLEDSDILINSIGRGYVAALSTGIGCCESEFFAFQDSDDFSDEFRLLNQISLLRAQNLDIVSGELIKTDSFGNTFEDRAITGKIPKKLTPKEKLIFGPHGADSTIVGRNSVFKNTWNVHQNFTSSFADYGWLLSVINSVTIGHCEAAKYFYRAHSMQMSRSAIDLNGWEAVFPYWLKNFFEIFGITEDIDSHVFSTFMSHPNVGLCLAFPSSLPKLNSCDREYLKMIIDYILDSKNFNDFSDQEDLKEILFRRGFVGTRGAVIKYWFAGLKMIFSITLQYIRGIKPRRII